MVEEKVAINPFLIFKDAWQMRFKNFTSLSILYLIFYLPYLFINLLMLLVSGDQSRILFFASVLVSLFSSAVLLKAADKIENKISFSQVKLIQEAASTILSFIVTTILYWIFVGFIFIISTSLLIIVFIIFSLGVKILLTLLLVSVVALLVYFAIRWSLAGVVCMVELSNPVMAFKRSLTLIKNKVNVTIATLVLIILIVIVFSLPYYLFYFTFSNLNAEQQYFVSIVHSLVFGTIANPLISLILVRLYRKLKEVET